MTNLEALQIAQRIELRLLAAKQALDIHDLEQKGEEANMAVQPAVADLILQFDAATDKIAARIAALIADGSFSAEDKAALQAEVDKLNSLGENPAQPIPPGI